MLDIHHIRAQFPALKQKVDGLSPVFFDSPGGSQTTQHVISAMTDYLSHYPANLGAPSFSSQKTEAVMSEARSSVATLLNAPEAKNIVFGAAATALVFHLSRVISNEWQAGDEIIVSALDHYSNVSPWVLAAKEKGVIVHQVPVSLDNYDIDYEQLKSRCNNKTQLIAITHASNTVGSIVDAKRICNIAKLVGAISFIDAVHYTPHALLDVIDLDCDFLVVSGYKFTGPHIAAIYGKTTHWERLTPYKVAPAANKNPNRWEQGTQNFEAMAGLSACINYLGSISPNTTKNLTLRQKLKQSFNAITAHERMLNQTFLKRLANYSEITLYGKPTETDRTPTFAFRIKNQNTKDFVEYAARKHVCLAHGNFYAKGLCNQLNVPTDGFIRVGCLHYHTVGEINRFYDVLDDYLATTISTTINK